MSAQRHPTPAFEQKICDPADVERRVRALGHPLVFTNGVFDLLHRGHATYLAQARGLGAALVVGVNTDASVRKLGKDGARPLNPQDDRLAVLAALESVSLVVPFPERTPLALIQRVRPDVYVKGGDYDIDALEEARVVRGWGGQALAIAFEHDRSTTQIIQRARGLLN